MKSISNISNKLNSAYLLFNTPFTMQDMSKSQEEEISKNKHVVAVVVIDIDISTADVNQCDASRKFYHY